MQPEEGDEVGQKIAEEMAEKASEEQETADEVEDAAAESEEVAEDAEVDLAATVVELEEELTQAKARTLRIAADFENYRKRSQREQEDARFRGREEVLRELLSVFDNLERAVDSAGTHEASEASIAILEGVAMVQKQFADGLSRYGLTVFSAKGKPFDPNFHEAMAQIASDEFAPGVVVQEYQKGYMLGERLLRAAMVVVSSPASTGSTKVEAEDDPKEESTTDEPASDEPASEEPSAASDEEGSA